jgi:hypothetical protein
MYVFILDRRYVPEGSFLKEARRQHRAYWKFCLLEILRLANTGLSSVCAHRGQFFKTSIGTNLRVGAN